MHSNRGEFAERVTERVAAQLLAAVSALFERSLVPLSDEQVVTALRDVETCTRRLTALQHRLLIEAEERSLPARTGAKTVKKFLMQTLNIAGADAGSRVNAARWVGAFRGLDGEPMDPQLPCTAEALAAGEVSADHVRGIAYVMNRVPRGVSDADREAAEELLAQFARSGSPDDIGKIGDQILAHLDPDGRLTTDKDRARMRGIVVGRQRSDGMSALRGDIDPVLRALLDPLLAKYARPGVCNPEDPHSPSVEIDTVDPAVLEQAARADHRSTPQRNHDALTAILSSGLVAEDLGHHRGMPVTTVLTMKLEDLCGTEDLGTSGTSSAAGAAVPGEAEVCGAEVRDAVENLCTAEDLDDVAGRCRAGGPDAPAGVATTATGVVVPIRDALRMAQRSRPYLAVFDHAGLPLHLGRMKRLASPAQRLALIAALRGCSRPGCDAPASLCAVHHVRDYAKGGPTDITNLVLACDVCHALIHDGPGGWKTVTQGQDSPFPGRTAWIAPEHIDPTRTPKINHRHHPDELLATILTDIHQREERNRRRSRQRERDHHQCWSATRTRPSGSGTAGERITGRATPCPGAPVVSSSCGIDGADADSRDAGEPGRSGESG